MSIQTLLKEHIFLLDGGMGTLLQAAGLAAGEQPERWNLSHQERVIAIHTDYFNAGSHIVNANTFGANILHYSHEELEAVIRAAIENAQEARRLSYGTQEKYVALDVGPTGRLLKPYGDLDFEDAVRIFAETVRLGVKYGADLIMIETMNDSYETKAALLAAKENSTLPVFVSNAYGEDGKLMTGATPEAMVALLEGMGADAIGVNCSHGPAQLLPVVERLLAAASVPVFFKPNAGLPKSEDGRTVYDVTPADFADCVAESVACGVRGVGGCCGTTPAYIQALHTAVDGKSPVMTSRENKTVISSYTHAVSFGDNPILIGERINPTGKKRFKQALIENDIDYVLQEGLHQVEKGVHVLDVNVGLPDINEKEMLVRVTEALQAIIDLPLQIDSADAVAMEAALRRYNGKAMINSVNGKKESMQAIFPLVKKYGGVLVALTLDEDGIPDTAEGRVEIARNILRTAEEYGLSRHDLIFDPLAMAVSADPMAAVETLRAVEMIRRDLGCHTVLGVSNVSFGLPSRDAINTTFFAAALERGLSAAIMNPNSLRMRSVWHTWRALHGKDENCADYIAFAEQLQAEEAAISNQAPVAKEKAKAASSVTLQDAIMKGLRDPAAAMTGRMLEGTPPLVIVQNEIIPALDTVGQGFEQNTIYLPQLLMSAEAAKAAFGVIKDALSQEKNTSQGTTPISIVLATVRGDIHDIGKNIVKLLLENYGFSVNDLGKDVPAEQIVDIVVRERIPLVGLSALMTTTVPAMEETIKLLRKHAPWCLVMVGGAVLNEDYAARIGADAYCKDAMAAVRYAEQLRR